MSRKGPVLVAGGGGRLARQLEQCGGQVVALPRAQLDIADPAAVRAALAQLRPRAVINPAAVSGLEAAAADEARAFRANAQGPAILAEACRDAGAALLQVSTDYVFGAPTDRAWREDDPVSPVNAYGASKAEGERAVLASGARATVVRVAWLFGDGGDFPSQMLRRGLETGSVTVAQDQIGSPTPIAPLAALMLRLAERLAAGEADLPPILHMAGSPPVARADWVEAAFEAYRATGREPPGLVRAPMASLPSTVVRPRHSALDTSLFRSMFGDALDWRPVTAELGRRFPDPPRP